MPSILEGVFSSSEDELNKMLLSLVGMPKAEIEAELSIIKSRVEEVAQTIPTKGNKGDKGDKGDQGIQGPKGNPGKDGRDGYQGKDGKQGVDGKAGLDGKDGVSIVDVNVAFDNHLVVTLSDGTEIDAGVIGDLNANLQNVVANYVSNGANGTLIFKGLWNASTNTPTLSVSSSDAGAYYVVNVAGSTNLSGITDWQVNDWAIFNGTAWQKIDNSDLFNASAVAITGGAIDGTTIGSTTASTGKFTSVTTPSVTATTTDLTLSSVGTNAINMNLNSGALTYAFSYTSGSNTSNLVGQGNISWNASGGGGHKFYTRGLNTTQQFQIADTASAVNYVQVTGGVTSGGPLISVQGSDANAELKYQTKGIFNHSFQNGSGAINFTIDQTAGVSVVNRNATAGSLAGFATRLYAAGSDTNISMAFQPKGTGAIDLAAGSSGVNISNGGTVTAITRTNAGANYTSKPTLTISAPTTAGGVQAVATLDWVTNNGATVQAGGTGYTVGDVLTVVGGTPVVGAATLTVATVSAGVITGVTVTNFGSYVTTPTNPVSVTGGTGSGATFNLIYSAGNTYTFSNAGSGYIEQPTVTFSGGGGSAAAAYATVGSSVRLQSLGTTSEVAFAFRGASGINSPTAPDILRILDVAAANDAGIFIQNSGFGRAQIQAYGNANANLFLCANGSGRVTFTTSGTSLVEQMRVSHTASAVNYVQVTGAATSGAPVISSQGSDANTPLVVQSKGTGAVNLNTGGGLQVKVTDTASAVNFMQLTGAVTTGFPVLQATGSDTNVGLLIRTKGTPAGPGLRFENNNGANVCAAIQMSVSSPVNYPYLQPAATGSAPTFAANGTDANIDLALTPKGTGGVAINSAIKLGGSADAGTSGYVLTSAGAGASPTWSASAGGGGMTLLGTITPTVANSISLGSLTLTSYKSLYIVINNVAITSSKQCFISSNNTQASGGWGTSTSLQAVSGTLWLDLGTGAVGGSTGENPYNGTSSLPAGGLTNVSTSTTTLYFRVASTNNFVAGGSIVIYGVK
jgi:hypothetical protein